MAIINANQTPPKIINSADTYNFGDGGSGAVNTTVFSLTSNAFSGTITLVTRAKGTNNAFSPHPYTSNYLNGAVGTGLPVSTAITDSSNISVDSTGWDVALDCTPYTSGEMSVVCTRYEG